MLRAVLVWVGTAACSFHPHPLGGSDAANGGSDAPDASEQGLFCYGTGLIRVCLPALPDPTFDVPSSAQLDTSSDPRCRVVTQSGAPDACVIAAQTITISAVWSVHGSRPLVVLATDTLRVAAGGIDASSYRGGQLGPGANDTSCGTQNPPPEADDGGAGGGAGGSFGAVGGNGGIGDSDMGTPANGVGAGGVAAAAITPTHVRGGCAGGLGGTGTIAASEGAPGNSGGAVYLLAGTQIVIAAQVRASGAGGGGGGDDGGGGGGGTGGLVGIEAPMITVSGLVVANGGGGGGGGDNNVSGGDPGNPGSDGIASVSAAAPGGSGPPALAGAGGAGGVGATDAQAGQDHIAAGGGGGGSVGVIYVKGALGGSGMFSPPASQH